jgi:arginyl-tRNA synthetase
LEHINFGTMNGKDGKPFRTRTGGVMKLKDLIELVTAKALERMNEINISRDYSEAERADIAQKVGIAALKFADLSNHYSKDYIFDLDRFSSFEGRTGPYLLYTAVRIKSILRTAAEQGLGSGPLLPPGDAIERELLLKLVELPERVSFAFEQRAPNHLCEYVYTLATAYNRFYHEHHIIQEEDPARQAAWLGLSQVTLRTLTLALDLLGIEAPERM